MDLAVLAVTIVICSIFGKYSFGAITNSKNWIESKLFFEILFIRFTLVCRRHCYIYQPSPVSCERISSLSTRGETRVSRYSRTEGHCCSNWSLHWPFDFDYACSGKLTKFSNGLFIAFFLFWNKINPQSLIIPASLCFRL